MKITRRRLMILVLCPILVLFTYVDIRILKYIMHRRRAKKILHYAELAPLPKSASEVKSYSKAFLFTGHHFLRFSATEADIEAFLKESPLLKGVEWTIYSKEKQRLVDHDYGSGIITYFRDENGYFPLDGCAPPWYMPEIRGGGRGCRFQTKKNNFNGEIIIDEENKLVFVGLFFG